MPEPEPKSRYTPLVLDAFGGPGGWDEGVRHLGIRPVGIELDHDACRTALAAGHARIRADVETFPLGHLRGRVTGLIMSPPCPDWSTAGKGAGLDGASGHLVLQVLRYADELRPRWIACEQVPPVLPLWRDFAGKLRGWGYKTWVGIVNAADYGVPQTRKRAILMASLDRQPCRPQATHARGGDLDLFSEYLPWVTMADALGWGMSERPYFTLATAGGNRGGADEQVGGSGARRLLYAERDRGAWVLRTGNNSMVTGRTGSRAGDGDVRAYERPVTEPAPTLDCNVGSKWAFVAAGVTGEGRPKDPDTQPADTLSTKGTAYWTDGVDKIRLTVEEAARLQSFPESYPWCGSATKKFQQVGNAVPPLLALHVVAEVLGVQVPQTALAAA
jgi:DNA (cytosine-5)-methyltransferase 1